MILTFRFLSLSFDSSDAIDSKTEDTKCASDNIANATNLVKLTRASGSFSFIKALKMSFLILQITSKSRNEND